jgi:hypothetical protein
VTFADASSLTTTATFSAAGVYVLSLSANDGELGDADEVTVAVAAQGSTIVRRPVPTGKDDAEESSTGAVNLNSADLELVLDGSRGNQTVGMRFGGVSVPNGAVITDAYVQFQTDRATSVATSLVVQGQAADNPGTFAKTSQNISSRPRTSSVPWDLVPAWPTAGAAGVDQRTSNISSIVQEIVNRPGWASGNAMVIIITGSGKRAAESFNGGAPPILHIQYGGSPQNLAPSANAGPDQAVTLPDAATMAGSASDDGLPDPPGAITTMWSQISGPQTVTFADATSPTTTVSFFEAGTYVLRLTADDGGLQTSDDVTITVNPVPGTNVAPVVSAGSDQTVTLPSQATMAGSASDDGLPSGSLTTTWSQVSGPGTATFTDPESLTTTVGFSSAGSYVLSLTGDDGALQSSDELTVTVNAAPSNLVGNPGFEVDTVGWNIGGSIAGVTLTRVSGGHSGAWAARLANEGASSGMCLLNDAPNWVGTTIAGTYSGSLWARADVAGATLRLRFREYSGGTLVGTPMVSQVQLTTTWQHVTVTIAPQSPGTSTLDLTAYVSSAPPGTCFYADDVLIAPSGGSRSARDRVRRWDPHHRQVRETVADPTLVHECRGLQPRVHPELREDVLDVGAGGLRADDEGIGDRLGPGAVHEQVQHLALTAGEPRDATEGLVLLVPAPHQASEEVPEHPRRDEGFPAVDRSCDVQELGHRRGLGDEAPHPHLERLLQDPVVFPPAHDHDLAPGDPLADQPRRLDPVALREVRIQEGDPRRRPLGLRHGLEAVTSLGNDLEVVLTLEGEAHGLAEQRLLVGEEYPHTLRVLEHLRSRRHRCCRGYAT